jgi:hypothetical protein
MVNVSTTGDLGDIVVMLATLKHIGKPVNVYLRDSPATKGIVKRADIITPLVEAQSYIKSVKTWQDEKIEWVSEEFRKGWHQVTQSLANSHARHALFRNIIPTMPNVRDPWITAPPLPEGSGRVVINRSPRYRNNYFPWQQIVNKYGNNLLFLGTEEDHRDFCRQFAPVEWRPTKNMLEVAGIIAASLLFIGNQSACMTIAEALKHPRIQEGCLFCPDCVYPASTNAQYVFDGAVTLPDFGGGKPLGLPSKLSVNYKTFHTVEAPRGGWRYDAGAHGVMKRSSLDLLARDVAKLLRADRDAVREEIIRQTAEVVPDFFTRNTNFLEFGLAVRALRDAGLSSPLVDAVEGRTPTQVL